MEMIGYHQAEYIRLVALSSHLTMGGRHGSKGNVFADCKMMDHLQCMLE